MIERKDSHHDVPRNDSCMHALTKDILFHYFDSQFLLSIFPHGEPELIFPGANFQLRHNQPVAY